MSRYNRVPETSTEEDKRKRYINVKYPLILPSPSDIYVRTGKGDRYDTLALSYYSDPSLWWVILLSNPNQKFDSLYPNIGSQLRIPSPDRISSIIADYNILNGF